MRDRSLRKRTVTLIQLLAAARRPALLLAVAALAACGQKGDLVRPTPKTGIAVQAAPTGHPATERATPSP
jgi:predicted small lipoprotein YifL